MHFTPKDATALMILVDRTISHLHDQVPCERRNSLLQEWIQFRSETIPKVRPVPAVTGQLLSSVEETDVA